jgi:hypothetical protein
MKNLFLILILCISVNVYSQKTKIAVDSYPVTYIEVPDSTSAATIKEFLEWSYDSKFDYESHIHDIQKIELKSMPKNISAKYKKGTITINSRITNWHHTYRKVLWLMIARTYKVKTTNSNRYNILSEGIIWGDDANQIYKNRRRNASELTEVKRALTKKHPLKSIVK